MLSIANEGENPAQWFASKGFTVFLLRYRTMYMGDDHATITSNLGQMLGVGTGSNNSSRENKEGKDQSAGMLQGVDKYIGQAADDARKAVEYVRAHAADYGIAPDKIAMMGFSAGCRTTLNVVYNHQPASHPDLVLAIYGQTDPHDALPASPMPLFIAAPEHDIYGVPTSFELYRMWQQAKLPAELHYFTGAPHGFGLKPDGEPTNIWPKLAYNFMLKTGFIQGNYLE
jgi:dienelactone hydrolase